LSVKRLGRGAPWTLLPIAVINFDSDFEPT
jgi:hypothetical protein